MRKFFMTAILFIVGLALINFFVANRQMVRISFDPSSLEDPAFYIGPMPMWAALALTLFVGYFLGAVGMWLSNGGLRDRARMRKAEIKRLKAELALATDGPRPTTGETLPARRAS